MTELLPEMKPASLLGSKQAIRQAHLELLRQPLGEGGEAPLQTVTTRLAAPIAERLGWTAAITGKSRQEVMAEALVAYFKKVCERG